MGTDREKHLGIFTKDRSLGFYQFGEEKKFISVLCLTIFFKFNVDNEGRLHKDRRGLSCLGEVSESLETVIYNLGFPGGSDSKESTCNAGDLGLISGSRRSAGEGNGNPLQYSCPGKLMDREA